MEHLSVSVDFQSDHLELRSGFAEARSISKEFLLYSAELRICSVEYLLLRGVRKSLLRLIMHVSFLFFVNFSVKSDKIDSNHFHISSKVRNQAPKVQSAFRVGVSD